jgi:hypothetical protein
MSYFPTKSVSTVIESPSFHDGCRDCVDSRRSPAVSIWSSAPKLGGSNGGASFDGQHQAVHTNQGLIIDRRDLYPRGFFSSPEEHDGPNRPCSHREIRRSFAFDEWDVSQAGDDVTMVIDDTRHDGDEDDDDDDARDYDRKDDDPVAALLWSSSSPRCGDNPLISPLQDHTRGPYAFQTIGRSKVTPLDTNHTPTTMALSGDASFGSNSTGSNNGRSDNISLGLGRFLPVSQCCDGIPRHHSTTNSSNGHQTTKTSNAGRVYFWGNSFSVAIEGGGSGDCRRLETAIECEWNERRLPGATTTTSDAGGGDYGSFVEQDESSSSSTSASAPSIPEFIFIRNKY